METPGLGFALQLATVRFLGSFLETNLKTYDAVVIAAGVDSSYEGEGADRSAVQVDQPGSFDLPEYQDDLIQKMAAANPHMVVCLHGGGSMGIQKWINQVSGLVHAIFPPGPGRRVGAG